MKKIKLFASILGIFFTISALGVNASNGSQLYTGITLPALKKEVRKGPEIKQTTQIQRYYNYSTLNSCTNNNNDINVRVESNTKKSDKVKISVGDNKSLTDTNGDTTGLKAYNILISNAVFSPCEAYHNGIWYYN